MTLADTAEALASEVQPLLTDEALRRQRGALAKAVIDENRGALERLLAVIDKQLA